MTLDDLLLFFLWYVAHKLSKMILEARLLRQTFVIVPFSFLPDFFC